MARDARVAFALASVRHAAAHYGVAYAEGTTLDGQIAGLLRAGCTVYPDAYVHSMASLAVRRAASAVARPVMAGGTVPFAEAVYISCQQYSELGDAQQDAIEFSLATQAGKHYGIRFEDTPAERAKLDEGLTPLVYGVCTLLPELYVYPVVARAVQVAAEHARAK